MNLRNRNIYTLVLLFSLQALTAFAHEPAGNSHFRFIENKGQWDSRALYRADLTHGSMYLEKNGFTYNLGDPLFFASLHGGSKYGDKSEFKGHAYKMRFLNFNPAVSVSGQVPVPEYFNYFLGKDTSNWASEAKAFTRVYYDDLYHGTDLKLYSQNGNVKYDLIIQPGANAAAIHFVYEGADKVTVKGGNLVIKTSIGDVTELRPYAYYQEDPGKVSIPCEYSMEQGTVSFHFPKGYDKTKTLIIDPELIFSTFSGSHANNFGYTATYDSEGNLYTGSSAFSFGYPVTVGAYDQTFNGGNTDIAITKYDDSGTFMFYSTYIGGSESELPHSMIVNSNDELFVFGTTGSPDFPVTANAYDTIFGNDTILDFSTYRDLRFGLGVRYIYGTDIIAFRLSDNGSPLQASTFLGGKQNDGLNSATRNNESYLWDTLRYNYADEIRGEIDIDDDNNIYIATCTSSPDFPIVGSSFQDTYGGGRLDGVVVKMDNQLSSIVWSSYLGGSSVDAIYSLSLDTAGNVYVTGGTNSSDFPVTDSVVAVTNAGGRCDAFITLIDQQGQDIIASTYYGTEEYDQAYFIELDFKGYVYILGQTEADDSAYVYNVAYSVPNSGQYISKFSPLLDTLMWSTAFGSGSGNPDISPTAFLVDICRKIYLSGWGGATNQLGILWNNAGYTYGMPITPDAFQSTTDGSDFYLFVMEDDASDIHYGSYMGGHLSTEHVDGGTSRFDNKGKVYQSVCAGCGANSDFPIKPNPGAVSPVNNSSCNNAVFKMDFLLPAVIADFDVPEIGCAPYDAVFENNSLEQDATQYFWDFGDGTTSTLRNPTHRYTRAGTYTIKLKLKDNLTCNLEDSTTRQIVIMSDTAYSLPQKNICPGEYTQIGIRQNSNNVTYRWLPITGLSDPTVPNPVARPEVTTRYKLLISNGVCTDTITHEVGVHPVDLSENKDSAICSSDPDVRLQASASGNPIWFHWSTDSNFTDRLNPDPSSPVVYVNPLKANNTYYIKARNQYGCEDVDTANVFVSDYGVTLSPNQYLCLGDAVELRVNGYQSDDALDYTWSPPLAIEGDTNTSVIIARPSVSTWYVVKAVNELGCSFVDSVLVEISPLTKDNLNAWADKDTVYEGTSTHLHARPLGFEYDWKPNFWIVGKNTPDPRVTPYETTEYTVTITDQRAGCRIDTSVTVHVISVICDEPNIYVPNAFTPNGDGSNDVLFVRGAFIEEMHFIIYDRWGEKVFESYDQNVGWDGKYLGREADPAVFVYYLELQCIGGKRYFKKGNVTLIR